MCCSQRVGGNGQTPDLGQLREDPLLGVAKCVLLARQFTQMHDPSHDLALGEFGRRLELQARHPPVGLAPGADATLVEEIGHSLVAQAGRQLVALPCTTGQSMVQLGIWRQPWR
jgi:hypothetical protein